MKKLRLLILIPALISMASCGSKKSNKEYFKFWNECTSLTTLKNYVEEVTNPNNKESFIPVEDRIATFDMDGTFIGELYATYFEYNMLEYRVLEDPTYKDIAPIDVKEVAQEIRDFVRRGTKLPSHFDMRHAYAAAKAYSGMTVENFYKYVNNYASKTPFGFTGMTYATSFYKPMLEVFNYLEEYNFTYYVVSGSDRLICRAIVDEMIIDENRTAHIPANRVIGMDVALKATNQGYAEGVDYTMTSDEEMIRTDELLIKNLKTNKVKQITQEIGKTPVLSFGNSSGDAAMHNFCKSNKKYKTEVFMLVADDNVRDHADLNEGAKRQATWEKNHYNIISMKNDFKTIYGYGVEKVDFDFGQADVREFETFEAFHEEANKAPANNYSYAEINIFEANEVSAAGGLAPIKDVFNGDCFATRNMETKEWALSDPELEENCKPYLDREAKLLNQTTADCPVFDAELFQNKELHYYSSNEGYRFRFKGDGKATIDNKEVSYTIEGVEIYNSYGLVIFSEQLFVYNAELTSTTRVSIDYSTLEI